MPRRAATWRDSLITRARRIATQRCADCPTCKQVPCRGGPRSAVVAVKAHPPTRSLTLIRRQPTHLPNMATRRWSRLTERSISSSSHSATLRCARFVPPARAGVVHGSLWQSVVRCTRFVERGPEVRAPCMPRTDARAYPPPAQSESHAVVLLIHMWRAAVADCLLSARIRAFGQVQIIMLLLCAGARGGDVRLQVPGREGEDPVPLRLGEMSRRDELM